MSKRLEAEAREIELAMRNAKPRSYYVCRAEDLPQRTSFAHRLRIYDLQMITEETYVNLASNPAMKLQFSVCFDPATKVDLESKRMRPALPSPHEAMNDTGNPGGSA